MCMMFWLKNCQKNTNIVSSHSSKSGSKWKWRVITLKEISLDKIASILKFVLFPVKLRRMGQCYIQYNSIICMKSDQYLLNYVTPQHHICITSTKGIWNNKDITERNLKHSSSSNNQDNKSSIKDNIHTSTLWFWYKTYKSIYFLRPEI